jgi:hypothetical protein
MQDYLVVMAELSCSSCSDRQHKLSDVLFNDLSSPTFTSYMCPCKMQVRVVKRVAFQQKQRAVREALAIGDQIARRRKQQLLAACFTAWHVQVRTRTLRRPSTHYAVYKDSHALECFSPGCSKSFTFCPGIGWQEAGT